MTTVKRPVSAPVQPLFDVGNKVEDFTLPLLDGGQASFSNYKGKTVLLVFIATWCAYCGAEALFLEKEIWQKFKERGVQILAIDVKDTPGDVKKFRDYYGWTFPVMLDVTGEVSERFSPKREGLLADVAIVNAHFVIDKEGVIRYREYLSLEHFDATAKTIARELTKVIIEK